MYLAIFFDLVVIGKSVGLVALVDLVDLIDFGDLVDFVNLGDLVDLVVLVNRKCWPRGPCLPSQ